MKTKKLKTMVTKMAVTAATAVLVAGVFAGCGTEKSAKEGTGDAVQKTLKIGVGGSEDSGYVLELGSTCKRKRLSGRGTWKCGIYRRVCSICQCRS